MRIWFGVVAVMLISLAVCAQMPVGGTFNNVQAQQVLYGTPITSPPIVSLGNGLTPTVITNRQPFVVGAPQFVAPEISVAPTAATGEPAEVAETPQQQNLAPAQRPQPRKRFDFVVSSAPSDSTAAPGDTRSLVEVAATTRKNRVTPMEGKTFTNDDVGRMNQKYGMRPQPGTPANPGPGSASSAAGTSGTNQTGTVQQTPPTQPSPAYANPPKR